MSKTQRKKSRMIVEARYPPLLAAFDRRGQVLKEVNDAFKNKMEHWKTENVAVHFADNFENPSKQILVDHLRTFIMYEDTATESEFADDAVRLFKILKGIFNAELTKIDRLGVRHISIFNIKNISSFEEAFSVVMQQYFSPNIPISIETNDCRAVLSHDNGSVNIGPAKEDEAWVKQIFSLPNKNVPSFGIGIDVDSYASNMEFNSEHIITKNINAVMQLTKVTEDEIIKSLEGVPVE